ncbi:hypothetical protein [Candidatus Nitrosocosmicus franklandus]|nr:hypothetical protein [Candidatus Nitrosocosmicus franklandus]
MTHEITGIVIFPEVAGSGAEYSFDHVYQQILFGFKQPSYAPNSLN